MTVSALAATPQPNEAANAIAANPSSAALRYSSSAPRPRPSLSEPRIVSGPVQNSSEEATKPSMNRCRSAEPVLGGQPALQPAAERPRPARSSWSSDPTMPPTSSDPSTTSIGALEPMWSTSAAVGDRERREDRDQQGDQAEAVGHDVAGALREPVPEEHAEARAEKDRGDVDERCRFRGTRDSSDTDGTPERSLGRRCRARGTRAPGRRELRRGSNACSGP